VRYIATFTPKAWVRNNGLVEVDPEGPTQWNCTKELMLLAPQDRAQIVRDGHDRLDLLKDDPNAPEWIREWAGPFDIHVRAAGATDESFYSGKAFEGSTA
jgi:hypothetical protein